MAGLQPSIAIVHVLIIGFLIGFEVISNVVSTFISPLIRDTLFFFFHVAGYLCFLFW